MKQADDGIAALKASVDTLIAIPNQRLLAVAGRNSSILETFKKADDILLQAVRGISDLITVHGLINLDFADVRTIMSEMGMAMMGAGLAQGENRAVEAAQRAISSPLLEDVAIHGARGVLINITGGPSLTLHEVNEAATLVQEEADEDANIIFGAVIDESMGDELRITVIATGFGERGAQRIQRPGARSSGAAAGEGRPIRRMGTLAEDELDVPTWQRRRQEAAGAKAAPPPRPGRGSTEETAEEDFDIPTFLRRGAE
jgi:cell division protein FtsZ